MENISFSKLGLSEELLRAVEDMGFEEATPIQVETIPLLLSGRDVIGHSHTGTGKTAAFGLPILQMIDPYDRGVQALILSPTRELAIQACEEIRKYAKYKNVKILPIYGGQQIERQIRGLKQGVQVVVGTPGRIMDHMRRRTLKVGGVRMVVLDEADEMLSMGFRDDMEVILKDTPKDRQTILFSATMPMEILRITREYQNDPQLVKVVHKQLTVPSVAQYYYEVQNSRKVESLCRLIDMLTPKLSLVFCNTKRMVDELKSQLINRGYSCDALHGDMNQGIRTRVMDSFRSGNIDILIATDVAARGIDVDDIECVFNFDLPQDEEYYVHRIGRTGRAGREGSAHTFISGRKQLYALRDLQRYTKKKITLERVPSNSAVEEKRLAKFTDTLLDELQSGNYLKYVKTIEQIEQMDDNEYTSIDIAAALLKMNFQKENQSAIKVEVDDYEDINANYSSGSGYGNRSGSGSGYGNRSGSRSRNGAEAGMIRLFMNIGRKDGVRPNDIVGAVAGESNVSGKIIGAIDIYNEYTFVEVPKERSKHILEAMKDVKIKGRRVNLEPAKPKGR